MVLNGQSKYVQKTPKQLMNSNPYLYGKYEVDFGYSKLWNMV